MEIFICFLTWKEPEDLALVFRPHKETRHCKKYKIKIIMSEALVARAQVD